MLKNYFLLKNVYVKFNTFIVYINIIYTRVKFKVILYRFIIDY